LLDYWLVVGEVNKFYRIAHLPVHAIMIAAAQYGPVAIQNKVNDVDASFNVSLTHFSKHPELVLFENCDGSVKTIFSV
jgi:hypothetical protein